jgi:cytokinin dehydrogenase
MEKRFMAPGRRTFLSASVGATAALASRTNGLTTPVRAASYDGPALSGDVSCEPGVRAAASHDIGRLVHKQPRAVRPASSADIAGLLRWAGSKGVKVAARGQGHSTYGRSLVEDGVVVDMSAISAIRRVEARAVRPASPNKPHKQASERE